MILQHPTLALMLLLQSQSVASLVLTADQRRNGGTTIYSAEHTSLARRTICLDQKRTATNAHRLSSVTSASMATAHTANEKQRKKCVRLRTQGSRTSANLEIDPLPHAAFACRVSAPKQINARGNPGCLSFHGSAFKRFQCTEAF